MASRRSRSRATTSPPSSRRSSSSTSPRNTRRRMIALSSRNRIPLTSEMKSKQIQAIRGMNDVLPDESPLWEFFEDTVRDWLRAYGYRNIRTPVVEQTDLFVRSIGAATDIVEKEVYTFNDELDGERMGLRPEDAAECVGALLEQQQV